MLSDYPRVPQFRELQFSGEPRDLDALASAIENRLGSPWSRAADVEEGPVLGGQYRVFRREEDAQLPAALLHLMDDGQRILVANIVPAGGDGLSENQYNGILVEFADHFAGEAAREIGLLMEVGPDEVDLGNELDEDTFRALLLFSRTSNRSTGSAHPSDREKWFDFMIQLHRSGRAVSTGVLQEFLMREGWSESVAWDLILEFEFGMGLLRRVEP